MHVGVHSGDMRTRYPYATRGRCSNGHCSNLVNGIDAEDSQDAGLRSTFCGECVDHAVLCGCSDPDCF